MTELGTGWLRTWPRVPERRSETSDGALARLDNVDRNEDEKTRRREESNPESYWIVTRLYLGNNGVLFPRSLVHAGPVQEIPSEGRGYAILAFWHSGEMMQRRDYAMAW